jgi:hypothetical protein
MKRCQLLPSHGTISLSMVKSVSGECHGGRDQRTDNGGSGLSGEMELDW